MGPTERRIAQALVCNFLLRDDRETDLSAGGLDDDEFVFAVVERNFEVRGNAARRSSVAFEAPANRESCLALRRDARTVVG